MMYKNLFILSFILFQGCTNSLPLSGSEFYDGTIFLNEEVYGRSTKISFSGKNYKVTLWDHYPPFYQTYTIEEGDFVVRSHYLLLTPHVRMICKVDLTEAIVFPCENLGNYEYGYPVNNDTIPKDKWKELGFEPKIFIVKSQNRKTFIYDLNHNVKFMPVGEMPYRK